jgi:hypothetical protein
MPLVDAGLRKVEPKEKNYKLYDGKGLCLLVAPSGGKWWRFNCRIAGRQKTLSLGVYPEVPLDEARSRRNEYRQMLAEGQDPGEYQKAMKQAESEAAARQLAATWYSVDNDGALSVKLGNRRVDLTPTETVELRAFLDATRAVVARTEG